MIFSHKVYDDYFAGVWTKNVCIGLTSKMNDRSQYMDNTYRFLIATYHFPYANPIYLPKSIDVRACRFGL